MSYGGRIATFVGLLAVAVALVVYAVVTYLTPQPAVVDFTSAQPAGAPVDITLQTVGSIGFGPHPTWVSYLVENPAGQWIHTTTWKVPAHTRINFTIEQFDSGSPLRNQQWGQVQGTIGHTAELNGKHLLGLRLQQHERGRPHVRHPHPRGQRAAGRGRPQRDQRVQHCALRGKWQRAQHPQVLDHDARCRASTRGSASCPAVSASCTATADR